MDTLIQSWLRDWPDDARQPNISELYLGLDGLSVGVHNTYVTVLTPAIMMNVIER